MKTVRAMVLVSNDPASIENGANEVYKNLEKEIKQFGLQDEISLSTMNDVGRSDASAPGGGLS